MARALLIGPKEKKAIAEAIEEARAATIKWEEIAAVAHGLEKFEERVTLADKERVGDVRSFYPRQVEIPIGFKVALSFEQQPSGLIRHLSVSVTRPGRLPHPAAVAEIAKHYGFSEAVCKHMVDPAASADYQGGPFRVWLEEFAPGHDAINLAELVQQ